MLTIFQGDLHVYLFGDNYRYDSADLKDDQIKVSVNYISPLGHHPRRGLLRMRPTEISVVEMCRGGWWKCIFNMASHAKWRFKQQELGWSSTNDDLPKKNGDVSSKKWWFDRQFFVEV
jgi:hypothetical protein